MLENGYISLKYILSQGVGELAAGNDSRNEPQSNALLRTTLRYLAKVNARLVEGGMAKCRYCGRSGWFMSVTENELCSSSNPVIIRVRSP